MLTVSYLVLLIMHAKYIVITGYRQIDWRNVAVHINWQLSPEPTGRPTAIDLNGTETCRALSLSD